MSRVPRPPKLGCPPATIEAIKGVATRDMPLAYGSLLLRGAPGSTVDLTVLRRKPEPQKMTLTRAAIAYPAVTSKMMDDKVGYVAPGDAGCWQG